MDATFVYGEASGWPLHMGALALFDPSTSPDGLDVDRVRELFRARLGHLGVFRHRQVRTPAGLAPPVWVEDGGVDVDAHIRPVRVPAPGGPRELAALVAELYEFPLDHSRPLWDKWFIEGIEGGFVGILDRIHHSATDGVRGMEISAASYDVDPTAPFERPGGSQGAGATPPSALALLAHAGFDLATTPVRAMSVARHVAGATTRLVGAARRGELHDLALPLRAPRTLFNVPISSKRGFVFDSLPLDDVKRVARREGVTVNDVLLSLTGGMLIAYLRERGALPERSLIAGVPVGLGTSRGGAVGGNSLSLMSASLHTDEPDPVARLHRVAASSKSGKAMVNAMGPELMMELVGLAPPILVAGAAAVYSGLEGVRIHPPLVNAVVSNVRGASIPLYLAGARMKATYPLGPIADGLGLNLTVISYVDSVDVGITVCPDLVPDPWHLVDALHAAMDELTPRRKRARRTRVPATAA